MSIDEQHVALPKLYGAPAYARPAPAVATTPRPFDPDDLPIEAVQTDEEREFAASLPARVWAPGGGPVVTVAGQDTATTSDGHHATDTGLQPRAFSLCGALALVLTIAMIAVSVLINLNALQSFPPPQP